MVRISIVCWGGGSAEVRGGERVEAACTWTFTCPSLHTTPLTHSTLHSPQHTTTTTTTTTPSFPTQTSSATQHFPHTFLITAHSSTVTSKCSSHCTTCSLSLTHSLPVTTIPTLTYTCCCHTTTTAITTIITPLATITIYQTLYISPPTHYGET